MKTITVLTGAGISAESGISTFRDAGGLWEGHDVMAVASPNGFKKNKALVLEFYNQRRRQLQTVNPNKAHFALAELDKKYHVQIITQNVDDLHERAGSKHILHLHGELLKAQSTQDPNLIYSWNNDITLHDTCALGSQLRPFIVWFGEDVPLITKAQELCEQSDVLIIIGTSMQVYPAAGLVDFVKPNTPILYIDPNPTPLYGMSMLNVIKTTACQSADNLEKLIEKAL